MIGFSLSIYLGANILSRRGLNLLSVLTGATLEDTYSPYPIKAAHGNTSESETRTSPITAVVAIKNGAALLNISGDVGRSSVHVTGH
jgi:hypothetical protein